MQRIDLGTGTPATGLTSCDPAHRTPIAPSPQPSPASGRGSGTIVVGEAVGGTGHVLEIIDPLHTTGVLFDRMGETLSGADAGNVALHLFLGRLAFKGIGILPSERSDVPRRRKPPKDRDHLADVCTKIGKLNDLNAEWTGGVFDGTRRRFFVSVQHNVTGHGVVLEITGWR